MMTLRDKRQLEFAKVWKDGGEYGILHLCPRFGKIRTSINILKEFSKNAKVLISYPDNKIKQSWLDDFETLGYDNPNITFTTHLSLKKYVDKLFDLVIIDEVHLLSEAQIDVCQELFHKNEKVLGLTGTLSRDTKNNLSDLLALNVVADYPLEKAIEEGIIVDYQITVVTTPLENITKQQFGNKVKTEKQQFDGYTWVINKMQQERKDTMFLRLARMRIIQSSLAKKNLTKKIIQKHLDERMLIFCGVTKMADDLGIPSYHSKSSEKKLFQEFAEGKGNHMAVVKIGNTGITYKPLNRVVINYFDSNSENLAQKIQRCTAMEYNNPDKKAKIYILSSNEDVELRWLQKALEFFDRDKITFVKSSDL
jgi:type I site-specific restriction endonuclease